MSDMLKFNDKQTEQLRLFCEETYDEPMTTLEAQDAARVLCNLYQIAGDIILQNEDAFDIIAERLNQSVE